MASPKTSKTLGKITVKYMALADTHGHYVDESGIDVFVQAKKWFKPDITIHLGDVFDWPQLRDGQTSGGRGIDLLDDLEAGKRVINAIKPNVVTLGNHDDRLFHYVGSLANRIDEANERGREVKAKSALEEYGARKIVDEINQLWKKNKTLVIPYVKGVGYNIGGVEQNGQIWGGINFTHGTTAAQNPCKPMADLFMGSVFFGHVHVNMKHTMANRYRTFAQSLGSMCRDEDLDYQRRHNGYIRHERGFVLGEININSGEIFYSIATKVGKKWIIPDPRPAMTL